MAAITRDNHVYIGPKHDEHVEASHRHRQQEQWVRLKEQERERYAARHERVQNLLQDSLAPAPQREPRAPSFDETPIDTEKSKPVLESGTQLQTAQGDRGWVLKKKALIQKYIGQWRTINRDFQDASENGLSRAAKAPGRGNWFENDCVNWAKQRGKFTETKPQSPKQATPFSGLIKD